ncbi:hypothetical protein [Methylobacterium sp. J-090]|uniref:hypothetical protein n=1 Tax=Methylobacterium sp. J-090 TaxID=2836666 RepID=UPI001FBBDDC2|nr:hypothetical protein [Methylobacterium sp. J-090]MCJ2083220.1 hypothetical protein [Methylobacterium sp. J-090]
MKRRVVSCIGLTMPADDDATFLSQIAQALARAPGSTEMQADLKARLLRFLATPEDRLSCPEFQPTDAPAARAEYMVAEPSCALHSGVEMERLREGQAGSEGQGGDTGAG